jgi:hypothetical protein
MRPTLNTTETNEDMDGMSIIFNFPLMQNNIGKTLLSINIYSDAKEKHTTSK